MTDKNLINIYKTAFLLYKPNLFDNTNNCLVFIITYFNKQTEYDSCKYSII